ncbi:MAG: HAD-IIIC family phosphatase [Candidatus Velthaea sp.]
MAAKYAEMPAFEQRVQFLVSDRMRNLDAATVISALAVISPEACLSTLVQEAAHVCASIDADAVSRALVTALASAHLSKPQRQAFARELFPKYVEFVTLETVERIVGAMPPSEGAPDQIALAERTLGRFPQSVVLLRAAYQAQAAANNAAAAHDLLNRLGKADPSAGTIAFIQREREKLAPAEGHSLKVALVSSYTIDFLSPYVDLECRNAGFAPQIYKSAFNSWAQDILDPASPLREFDPDITFLSLALDDLFPELADQLDAPALEAGGAVVIERIEAIARHYATWAHGRPLVVHALYSAYEGGFGIHDGRETASRVEWVAGLNALLAQKLRELPGCFLLNVPLVARRRGVAFSDNPKLRHMASIHLPPQVLPAVAEAYLSYIVPLKGMSKKCVVLDLDNTLWGGVVGEDTKDGIRLGPTSPGSEFMEFQRFLASLPARGILLALNSKNNPDDALDVIRTHESMVLRESAFSAIRINWDSKPDNMLSIARELNIGVDSLIFVDDNPDERQRMRHFLPAVQTVEMPKDPALYRSALEALPQLQTLAITSEDRARTTQYSATRMREQARTATGSVDDYLQSLEIAVEIAPAARSTFARVAQLFAKTNQFNSTTRRYSLSDVEQMSRNPDCEIWTLQSKDRFGDHGLVAVALLRRGRDAWTIGSFLMSCRVIGYGIESALITFIADRARQAGARELVGEFIETKKNAPAKDLYARHGFALAQTVSDVAHWTLPLAEFSAPPKWISITTHDA